MLINTKTYQLGDFMSTEWLNAEESAKYLDISTSNLYSLAQQGRIPGHRIGKMWRFNRLELDAWIRSNKPINEFFTSVETSIEDNIFLRDPQREGHLAAVEFFEEGGQKAIEQLPVGCGKSGLISLLPFGIARGRVLVIAPNLTIRKELERVLDVSNKRFCFWNKCRVLTPEVMTAGPYLAVLDGKDANIHDCDRSHIVLTNIQQLASSADRWLPAFSDDFFDLILVDEGHHSAAPIWKKVFEKFNKAKVINLTATPFRSDNKDIEGELIYKYSFKRAMLKGYIKKLRAVYVAPEEIYFTYQGDSYHHTLEDVLALREEEWFSRGVALAPECNRHIVDTSLDRLYRLRESGTNHQLIAVAMSVKHAKDIKSLYSERGYEAEVIHSQMNPDEQTAVLQKLRAGLLDCIIQVQMLGEGFDHPKLSVAAIFRPFRTLSPYVQFVGRIMRVIVQNNPVHWDNNGFIVTHIGMNLDSLLDDFRDMERENKDYFEELLSGHEPEIPDEVIQGKSRMKLRPDMVVHREIVSNLFEEDFVDNEDSALFEDMKAYAESLGLDGEAFLDAYNKSKQEKRRSVNAPPSLTISPQRKRKEARKRLTEEVKFAARLLLNRLGLDFGGHEISFKLSTGVRGSNFPAAVQLINAKINEALGIKAGQRDRLKTEDFGKAIDSLEDILNKLTRQLKGRISENGENG